jgi:LysR family transcriptional regulator for metE and metH
MIELKHLKTLKAIEKHGSLIRASEELCTSQSALSHQIKKLEQRLNCTLFNRHKDHLSFTKQGYLLCDLANRILPEVQRVTAKILRAEQATVTLAMTCYSCYQWLIPLLNEFKQDTGCQIELLSGNFDSTTQADIVLSDSPNTPKNGDFFSEPVLIGGFKMVLIMSPDHALAQQPQLSVAELAEQTIITYPLPKQQLDIFNYYLLPAFLSPKQHRTVDNSMQLLQMVAANMGVALVPDWLVGSFSMQQYVITKPIASGSLSKQLWLHYRLGLFERQHILRLIDEVKVAFATLTSTTK